MSIMGKGQIIRAGLYTHQSPRLWALTESVLRLAWPRVGPYYCEAHGFRLYPIHFLQVSKDKEAKHQQSFLLKGKNCRSQATSLTLISVLYDDIYSSKLNGSGNETFGSLLSNTHVIRQSKTVTWAVQ